MTRSAALVESARMRAAAAGVHGAAASPTAAVAGSAQTATATATAPENAAPLDQSRMLHLVGYAASRASVELKKAFRRHLGPLDLKAVEFTILILVASNARVSQKQLGLALDVSPPNLALTLDRMAERGWLRRVRGTVDRRTQLIELTDAGHALHAQAEQISQTMERDVVDELSDAERLLLIELLHRVAGTPRTRV